MICVAQDWLWIEASNDNLCDSQLLNRQSPFLSWSNDGNSSMELEVPMIKQGHKAQCSELLLGIQMVGFVVLANTLSRTVWSTLGGTFKFSKVFWRAFDNICSTMRIWKELKWRSTSSGKVILCLLVFSANKFFCKEQMNIWMWKIGADEVNYQSAYM